MLLVVTHRTGRPRPCAGPGSPLAGCRDAPSAACAGSSGRAASRPETRPRPACRPAACSRSPPDGGGSFFERSGLVRVLTAMPRPGADVREAKARKQLANRPLVVVDAEAAPDQRLQVDTAPTHHAVGLECRTRLDEGCQFSLLVG